LIEAVLALALLTAILAAGWAMSRGLRRQSDQVLRHLDALSAAASVIAQLGRDADLLVAPTGAAHLSLGGDGARLSFFASRTHDSPEDAPPGGGTPGRLTWRLSSDDAGDAALVRELVTDEGTERRTWVGSGLETARFEVLRDGIDLYLVLSLGFRATEAAGTPPLPIRWVRRLPRDSSLDPRFLPPTPGGLHEILPPPTPSSSGGTLVVPSS
jgi:hypothetical protein